MPILCLIYSLCHKCTDASITIGVHSSMNQNPFFRINTYSLVSMSDFYKIIYSILFFSLSFYSNPYLSYNTKLAIFEDILFARVVLSKYVCNGWYLNQSTPSSNLMTSCWRQHFLNFSLFVYVQTYHPL